MPAIYLFGKKLQRMEFIDKITIKFDSISFLIYFVMMYVNLNGSNGLRHKQTDHVQREVHILSVHGVLSGPTHLMSKL